MKDKHKAFGIADQLSKYLDYLFEYGVSVEVIKKHAENKDG